uniref:Uncharacterized protein n=1 Tax=Rhizophora mucronata TaxID=61149 RepID=A0A2P2N6X8_RHIMU
MSTNGSKHTGQASYDEGRKTCNQIAYVDWGFNGGILSKGLVEVICLGQPSGHVAWRDLLRSFT